MTIVALISAILFGTIGPLPVDFPKEIRAGAVLSVDDCIVAAVIPDGIASHERRQALLEKTAADLAARTGRYVILTEDILTYLTLLRMQKKGVNDYERNNLASCLARVQSELRFSDPPWFSSRLKFSS